MKTAWQKGLDAQEADEIRLAYIGSHAVRKRLVALLNEKISSQRGSSLSVSKYDSPGWPYLQADAVRYERALNEVISLISEKLVE